jgi:hypothetical protein
MNVMDGNRLHHTVARMLAKMAMAGRHDLETKSHGRTSDERRR